MIRYLIGIPVWAVALYGTLQLHSANFGLTHGICGKWGCGPPVEALLGWHGFSLLLVLPITILLGLYLSDGTRHRLGNLLFWGALATIVVYMIQDGVNYESNRLSIFVQRALFSVATEVDFPMLQVAAAGFCLRLPIWNRSVTAVPPVGDAVSGEPVPS